jgi:hypothetical protein
MADLDALDGDDVEKILRQKKPADHQPEQRTGTRNARQIPAAALGGFAAQNTRAREPATHRVADHCRRPAARLPLRSQPTQAPLSRPPPTPPQIVRSSSGPAPKPRGNKPAAARRSSYQSTTAAAAALDPPRSAARACLRWKGGVQDRGLGRLRWLGFNYTCTYL